MILISMGRAAKLLLFTAAMATWLLALTACGGGGSSTATVTSVDITAEESTVPLNESTDITATVNLSTNTVTTSTAVTFLINGTACTTIGASCPSGSIVPSPDNPQVGVYTSPSKAPGINNNMVNITATAPQVPSSTTDTAVVTSNTVTITIGSGVGLAVTPVSQTCPAGSTVCQFTATLNSVNDPAATWTVNPVAGVNVGSIDSITGLYTAPPSPPPGGSVTITAMDPAANPSTATATAIIDYGDASLKGPYAFAFAGGTGANFEAVSGSFVADGAGSIESGIEDVASASTGVHKQVAILQGSSYLVRSDGRVTATLKTGLQVGGSNVQTLDFAFVSGTHAVMIRFDAGAAASGTVDQQSLDALTNSPSLIDGPMVFGVSGVDSSFNPMGIAGEFSANGSGGIPETNTVVDVNDNGTVTTLDRTLQGGASPAYSFDSSNPGTGRGTLTLTSTSTGERQFAFYIVDTTEMGGPITHLKMVEIDKQGFLGGDVFQEFTPPFSGTDLTAGNYVFTSVGTSGNGPYADGGVFTSDGSANITGGAFDVNNAGAVPASASLGSCPYSVDAATGRLDLKLFSAAGACAAGPAANVAEFATYQTAQGTAVMLELDAAAVTTGLAYQQTATAALPAGSYGLQLATDGVGQNSNVEQDATGQATLSGLAVTSGNLDINSSSPFPNDPLNTTNTSFMAPAANGRGTAVVEATDPVITFNVDYYIINASSALFLGTDTTRVGSGVISRQF